MTIGNLVTIPGDLVTTNSLYATTLQGGLIVANTFAYANGQTFVNGYSNADVAGFLPLYGGNATFDQITGTLVTPTQPYITETGVLVEVNTNGNINVLGMSNLGNSVIIEHGNLNLLDGALGNIFTNANIVAREQIYAGANVVAEDWLVGNYLLVNNDTYLGSIFTDGYFYANGEPFIGGGNISNTQIENAISTVLPSYSGNIGAGNITVTGNVESSYFFGNGAFLTGITGGTGNSNYSNANVALYLPVYTGNLQANNITTLNSIVSSGNIRGANFNTNGQVVAVGNISGNYILGNGAFLTGIPSSYGNSNVELLLETGISNNIITTGDVVVGNLIVNSSNVRIGSQSAQVNQGIESIAIGILAAQNNQGSDSIAIGATAGQNDQGPNAIAIGYTAGVTNQGSESIAIGDLSGSENQGEYSIALGYTAGRNNQGNNAIAIGQAGSYQVDNSIIIDVNGSVGNIFNSGLYINPVRNDLGNTTQAVYYNTTTKEMTFAPTSGGNGNYGNTNIVTTGNVNANIITSNTAIVNGNANIGNLTTGNIFATIPFNTLNTANSVYFNAVTNEFTYAPSGGGSQGTTGAQGATGTQGTDGLQGVIGSTGTQGTDGANGSQGVQGTTGVQGDIGSTGVQGTSGVGSQGVQGAIGNTGAATTIIGGIPTVGADPQLALNTAYPTAPSGSAVYADDTNDLWVLTGTTWINVGNLSGPQGLMGSTGVQGATGSTGVQGTTGAGSQGTTGSTGAQGIIGSTGAQGATGIGSQGTTGTQGTTGSTGTQGVQGNFGSQGIIGNQGTTGAQGTIGTQGTQGVQGVIGSQGATGDTNYGNANVSAYLASATNTANIITTGNLIANKTVYGATSGTNGVAFVSGNGANSNIALQMGWNQAIRDVSANASSIFFDVSSGGTANGNFQFRTTNSFTPLATISTSGVTTTGNVSGTYILGNGSQLTGITSGGNYGNSNVATYLASGTNTSNVITTGNVSGIYILGNAAFMTGIPSSGNAIANAQIAAYLASGSDTSNIITTGNVRGTYLLGNARFLTGVQASNPSMLQTAANAQNLELTTTGLRLWNGPITGNNPALNISFSNNATWVGVNAGNVNTANGTNSVAIGRNAGMMAGLATNQVAIGAYASTNRAVGNTIVINATGGNLDPVSTQTNSFYVAPIRNDTGNTINTLYYNTTTKEISYNKGIPVAGKSQGQVAGYYPLTVNNFTFSMLGSKITVTGTGSGTIIWSQLAGNNNDSVSPAGGTFTYSTTATQFGNTGSMDYYGMAIFMIFDVTNTATYRLTVQSRSPGITSTPPLYNMFVEQLG